MAFTSEDSNVCNWGHRVFRSGPLSTSQRAFIDGMDAAVRLPSGISAGRVPVGKHPLVTNRMVLDQVARVMRAIWIWRILCSAELRVHDAQARSPKPRGISWQLATSPLIARTATAKSDTLSGERPAVVQFER
jgi:hypothetical protein